MKDVLKIGLLSAADDVDQLFSGLNGKFNCKHFESGDFEQGLDAAYESCDVILAEVAGSDAIEQLTRWTAAHDRTRLYALSDSADLNEGRKLMRAGAKDVFVRPLQRKEIIRELVQDMRELQEEQGAGKVVSFINAKGGNGATTIAVNTAMELVHETALKTLLIDLNVQFGDVASLLDLHPTSSVMEALTQSKRLDSSLLNSLVTKMDNGLHVLPSPGKLESLEHVRKEDVQHLLEVCMSSYDLIVIDLPRIVVSWVDEVLKWSDHLFLVLQSCVASVRDGHLLQEHFAALGLQESAIHYLLNRSDTRHGLIDEQQMKKSLRTDKLIAVRNDYNAAQRAADMGTSVEDVNKRSHLSKDIRQLSHEIITLCGHKHVQSGGAFGWLFQPIGGSK